MTKLIINADDFGYCEAVNYGIVSAHQKGGLKSTTIMANMPGFEHGVKLLQDNPELRCGIHMTLSCGRPVLNNLKTIVDDNGNFYKRITGDVLEGMDLEEIYNEFCAQIEKVKSHGVEISHLDSHHHVHSLRELKPVLEKILEKYNLPVRGGFKYNLNYDKVVPMIDSFYKDNVTEDYFKNRIDEIKNYKVVDLMTHPAYLDSKILESTSYAIERTKEYNILVDEKLSKLFEENDIEISTYKDI